MNFKLWNKVSRIFIACASLLNFNRFFFEISWLLSCYLVYSFRTDQTMLVVACHIQFPFQSNINHTRIFLSSWQWVYSFGYIFIINWHIYHPLSNFDCELSCYTTKGNEAFILGCSLSCCLSWNKISKKFLAILTLANGFNLI